MMLVLARVVNGGTWTNFSFVTGICWGSNGGGNIYTGFLFPSSIQSEMKSLNSTDICLQKTICQIEETGS